MKGVHRRRLLALALAGTLVAAWFAPPAPREALAVATPNRGRVVGSSTTAPVASTTASPRAAPTAAKPPARVLEIHAREAWAASPESRAPGIDAPASPPPPTLREAHRAKKNEPAPPPEPPMASAPPLPFTLLGRYGDGRTNAVFLRFQEKDLVVRVGDTVAEHYKVESLDAATLTLRYLPLNQLQPLDLSPFETKE